MAQLQVKPKTTAAEKVPARAAMFDKENIWLMIAGAVVMGLGYLLMSGGKSSDPNVFDAGQVYSTTRITIAPILILLGLAIEIYALLRSPKKSV